MVLLENGHFKVRKWKDAISQKGLLGKYFVRIEAEWNWLKAFLMANL
jgi:hypothetical protein